MGLEKDKDVSGLWQPVRWTAIGSRMGRKERQVRMDLVAGKRGSCRRGWMSIISQSWCSGKRVMGAGVGQWSL